MKKQIFLFLAALLIPLTVNATIITGDYTGTVTALGDWLSGDGVDIGNEVTGSFTYDSDLGQTDSLSAFSVSIGSGFSASMDDGGSSWFRVNNDSYANPADGFTVGTSATSDLLNGYTADVMQFGVFRYNFQGQLWDDSLLPDLVDWGNITLADINRADWRWMDFGASSSEDPHYVDQIRWDVQSFSYDATDSVNSIPEPSTIILLAAGLLGLRMSSRKVHR